jgi:hypothetical protein
MYLNCTRQPYWVKKNTFGYRLDEQAIVLRFQAGVEMFSFNTESRQPHQQFPYNEYCNIFPRDKGGRGVIRPLTSIPLQCWSQGYVQPHHHSQTHLQAVVLKKKTLWPESASELYRPSNRLLSTNLVPTFGDRGCHVVGVTNPCGRILGFLDRSRYFFYQGAPQLYSRGWRGA